MGRDAAHSSITIYALFTRIDEYMSVIRDTAMVEKGTLILTAQEFDALRPRLGRLALNTIEIARAVLVEGMTQTEAANHHSMTRQRVYGIVQRFRAAAQEVPTGWRRVEVWLPPEVAVQVEAMEKKARADYAGSSNQGN